REDRFLSEDPLRLRMDGGICGARWALVRLIDPRKPRTISAGSKVGGGLFTSTNGGRSWQAMNVGARDKKRSERSTYLRIVKRTTGKAETYRDYTSRDGRVRERGGIRTHTLGSTA